MKVEDLKWDVAYGDVQNFILTFKSTNFIDKSVVFKKKVAKLSLL